MYWWSIARRGKYRSARGISRKDDQEGGDTGSVEEWRKAGVSELVRLPFTLIITLGFGAFFLFNHQIGIVLTIAGVFIYKIIQILVTAL